MEEIKEKSKNVRPVKHALNFVIVLVLTFLIDCIVMYFLLYFGCMEWLKELFADLLINYNLTDLGSQIVNGKEFLIAVLKSLTGFSIGVGIFVFTFCLVPCVIMVCLENEKNMEE